MPFVVICKCGHRNGYGSAYCVACEGKIDLKHPPKPLSRNPGESNVEYAKRCGPIVVEEKPKGKR